MKASYDYVQRKEKEGRDKLSKIKLCCGRYWTFTEGLYDRYDAMLMEGGVIQAVYEIKHRDKAYDEFLLEMPKAKALSNELKKCREVNPYCKAHYVVIVDNVIYDFDLLKLAAEKKLKIGQLYLPSCGTCQDHQMRDVYFLKATDATKYKYNQDTDEYEVI